jgi:hypothetical protein
MDRRPMLLSSQVHERKDAPKMLKLRRQPK